jgi:MFS family permease
VSVRTVRKWVGETAGGLPRQFWYLWSTTLINRMGSFVLVVLAIYLTQVRGFSESFAGLVIGLWGAGSAVGTMVGGVLADRWGRKPTFLTALYGNAAMMLVLGFVHGPVATAVSVVVLGFVAEGSRPAMSALMVDIVPERDRVRAFSLNYWVINLGFAFSATIAGLLIGVDVRLLFLLDAATTIAAATFLAFKVREPVRARATVTPSVVDSGGLGTVLRDRVFLAFVGVNLLTALVFLQHLSTLPMSMSRDGLPASTYGTVIALNGVLIVAGQLFLARLLKRLRRTTALAVAAVVLGIGFGLTAFANTAAFYALTVLIWTAGEMFHAPSNASTVADLSPAHMRGRYQGVFSLSWSAAGFFAPLLGGAVLQYAGPTTLWLGCLGLALVVAAIHLSARPSRERRAAELAAAAAAAASPTGADHVPATMIDAKGPHSRHDHGDHAAGGPAIAPNPVSA